MLPPGRRPGIGWAFVGVAAPSLATGPTLVLLAGIRELLDGLPTLGDLPLQRWWGTMAYSSLICLIGSIPAASLNAIVLGVSARKNVDVVWWAMSCGGAIGLVTAAIFAIIFNLGRLPGELVLWFSSTGALMGALHWCIAIRPRRRWRLSLLRDDEAIRAME
jgi:hypothetical protein